MTESLTFSLVRRGGYSDARELSEPLDLTDVPDTDPPSVRVTEDEPVEFVLRCAGDVRPRLYVQDVELDPPFRQTRGDLTEYRWEPHPGGPGWFLNHFGYCILTLESLSGPDREGTLRYAAVEVFARKPNAERAERILDYLESRMEDVTRSCFNAAHPGGSVDGRGEDSQGGEIRQGNIPASALLQAIGGHLRTFAAQTPRFRYRKRCRLAPMPARIKASQATNLTEHSVHWALTHLDTLMPVGVPTPASIAVGGRFYELDEIETYALSEVTDVYENQVIAGYLESIAARLSDVERFCLGQLQALESEGFVAQVPARLRQHLRHQAQGGPQALRQAAGRVRRLAARRRRPVRLLAQAPPRDAHRPGNAHRDARLPVLPALPPGLPAGRRLARAGPARPRRERFLYGLRTIDRLYEFYCLFRLVETLRESGWESAGQERRPAAHPRGDWDARPDDVYAFSNRAGERVTLFYEPQIERTPGDALGLVRSMEGGPGFLPDFVLKFEPEEEAESPSYLILDAKYVSPYLALNFEGSRSELSKITMKYLHGIGASGGGRSPVQGIFVLHPQSFHAAAPGPPFRAYHVRGYDLFSETPPSRCWPPWS